MKQFKPVFTSLISFCSEVASCSSTISIASPRSSPEDTAIAKGVVEGGGQEDLVDILPLSNPKEVFQLPTPDQRHISVEHEQTAGEPFQLGFGRHDCMAGSKLLPLQDYFYSKAGNGLLDPFRLVTEDKEGRPDIQAAEPLQDVMDKWLSTYGMEHLRQR